MKKAFLFLAALTACIAGAAELELVKAFYGSKDRTADVTEAVRKNAIVIPGVLLAMPVDNNLLGGDPAPRAYKQLIVICREAAKRKKPSPVRSRPALFSRKIFGRRKRSG